MGAINLKHTGSGSDVTLSSDGTDLLLDGTAIGGGGGGSPDLFAENYDGTSTAPSATGDNAVAIGTGFGGPATASGFNAIALGVDAQSTGGASVAMAYSIASASYSFSAGGGNSQVYGASGDNSVAIGTGTSARGSGSAALGQSAWVDTTGTQAVALGDSRASGIHSLAAAISTNSSSYGAIGANSIAIGYRAKASEGRAVAIGGSSNIADGPDSVAIGGQNNTAGTFANGYAIASGYDSHAYGAYSIALGNRGRALEDHKYAHGVFPEGSQYGRLILKAATTDATATAMISAGSSASTDNQIILPDNSAYAFHGTIVARESATDGTDCAAWKVEGLIRREGSAGTTVLVNSATTVLDNTPSWGMALSADTTNGGLAITVTGAASTNIRWVATIHTSEVIYA